MKKIKKIIIILMIIILILIMCISINLLIQKNRKKIETNSDLNNTQEISDLDISFIKDESEYHDIERIINSYFSYINYLDYNYFQFQMNNDEKNKEKYFNKGKELLKNILVDKCMQEEKWETILLKYTNKEIYISEMNKTSYNNISVYLVTINYDEEKNNVLIFIDNDNEAFSILPSEYLKTEINKENLHKIIKEINIEKVDKNENNKVKKIQLDDENICIQYYYDYLNMLRNNTERLYDTLDKEYREKRFGDIDNFKEYINSNREQLEKAILSKYQVNKKDNYTEYMCVDEEGRYYIFNATAAMKYTMYLDTYTADLPEFTEKYNTANEQQKVALNINKIITALNAQDYKYIYSKLADSFKNNYFESEEALKEYLVKNLYENNIVEFEEFSREGTLYTYKIKVTKKLSEDEMEKYYGKNAPSQYMNIVMQLNEGTDFVMSFSIQE